MLPAIGAVGAGVKPAEDDARGACVALPQTGVSPGAEALDDVGVIGLTPPTAWAAADCFIFVKSVIAVSSLAFCWTLCCS